MKLKSLLVKKFKKVLKRLEIGWKDNWWGVTFFLFFSFSSILPVLLVNIARMMGWGNFAFFLIRYHSQIFFFCFFLLPLFFFLVFDSFSSDFHEERDLAAVFIYLYRLFPFISVAFLFRGQGISVNLIVWEQLMKAFLFFFLFSKSFRLKRTLILLRDTFRFKSGKLLFTSLVMYSTGFVLLQMVLFLWKFFFGALPNVPTGEGFIRDFLSQANISVIPLLVVLIGVIGPFFEEVVFRFLFFNLFSNDYLGLFFSTFAFSIYHLSGGFELAQIIFYLPFSFILSFSYLYFRRNLAFPLSIHMLVNTLYLLMFYLGLS